MSEEKPKEMTPIVVLRNFFGQKPHQTMAEFLAEVKQLSDDERIQLATLAAKELGVTIIAAKPENKK